LWNASETTCSESLGCEAHNRNNLEEVADYPFRKYSICHLFKVDLCISACPGRPCVASLSLRSPQVTPGYGYILFGECREEAEIEYRIILSPTIGTTSEKRAIYKLLIFLA
ncbi:MAG: hypothetical protein LUF04_03030, partial [Bacteroides sp.]|nr:hypothetical protein [Bacteroides sp.]